MNKIKELWNKISKKKYAPLIIIIPISIILIIFIATIIGSDENTITYKEINTIIKNKDNIVIYYYNNKSNNKYNKKIKKYLNKEKIKYYTYHDENIDKKEYNQFLKLLKIDKKLFGCPSLIYIKDGKMYANIINIDNLEVVKQFIDNYDLYTEK